MYYIHYRSLRYSNNFVVWKLARGKLTREKDNFLSPYIPIDEDEYDSTEAFLKVLKHATPELIDSFLQFIHIEGTFSDYIVDFQMASDLQLSTDVGVLIGIAETTIVVERGQQEVAEDDEGDEERDGIPDGFLYARNGSLSVLFEMKRGGGKLYRPQLEAHKKRFLGVYTGGVREEIVTWKSVVGFFTEQRKKYDDVHRNALLLDSFLGFCKIHMVGENTTEVPYDRHLAVFSGKAFEVVRTLNEYALSLMNGVTPYVSGALEYKYPANALPFFTIWPSKKWLIFKPKGPYALHIDLLVAKLFGKNMETPFDDKANETFVHVDWVQTDDQIKFLIEMILYSFNSKYQTVNLTASDFIRKYDITKADYENSRLGRKEQSFFHEERYQRKVESEREKILSVIN